MEQPDISVCVDFIQTSIKNLEKLILTIKSYNNNKLLKILDITLKFQHSRNRTNLFSSKNMR